MPTISTFPVMEDGTPRHAVQFIFNESELVNATQAPAIQEIMATQLKTYFTFAMGELLKDPAMKELFIPKIREYMEQMSLADILEVTDNKLDDIGWLWKEE